jgi:hypothetical protein
VIGLEFPDLTLHFHGETKIGLSGFRYLISAILRFIFLNFIFFKVTTIPGYLLNYRYKTDSMQREKELYEGEVKALMLTLHPYKYSAVEILQSHSHIMTQRNEKTVETIHKFMQKFPQRWPPYLWLGMYAEQDGLFDDAARYYDQCISFYPLALNWQPLLRRVLISSKIGMTKSDTVDLMNIVLSLKPDITEDETVADYFEDFSNP